MLYYDTKRAFLLRYINIGVFCFLIMTFILRMDVIIKVFEEKKQLEHGWALTFVLETLMNESLLFFLPILSSLPYSTSFIDESKAGSTRLAISRVKKSAYLHSKALTCALSGSYILAAGVLSVLVVSLIIFAPMEQPIAENIENSQNLLFIKMLLTYSISGALWAEVGLFFSTLLKHRLMAWLSPFMLYYLLIIFQERYFEWCYILYPKEWINPKNLWPMDNFSVSLWLLTLVLFVGYAFIKVGERRLKSV